MKIFLSDDEDFLLVEADCEQRIFQVAEAVAELYGLDDNVQVSISLVGDERIRDINREYRGVDSVTDVISFALDEGEDFSIIGGSDERLLGEIVVCVPQMLKQAQEYGHGMERELAYLIVHGFLHLLGYDHMNEDDKADMREEEEAVMEKLGLPRA